MDLEDENKNDAPSTTAIWYITNAELKQYSSSYMTSRAISSSQQFKTATMERVLSHSRNGKIAFSIYRIVIDERYKQNDTIFLKILHRDRSNQNWTQITHRTFLGSSSANHKAIKPHGIPVYVWKISKKDAVYLLDSRANEANASIMFYDKVKQSEYYVELIGQFEKYLFYNVAKECSPYLVLKTLNAIYQLLTDEKQLNWSYINDVPVQTFLVSLRSRITMQNKTACECLISLFVLLCACSTSKEHNCFDLNESLQTAYDKLQELIIDKKLITLLRVIFNYNQDTTLIDQVKHSLLLKIRKNFLCKVKDISSVKSYYYLLWYNVICCVYKNAHNPFTQLVKQLQIAKSQLTFDDLLTVIELDQRLIGLPHKEFLLTDLLMDHVFGHLKKLNLKQRQNKLFDVIAYVMDVNDLYHMLVKYETFIFGSVIIDSDYQIWLKFVRCLHWKMSGIDKIWIVLLKKILNKFCVVILKISDEQKSKQFFDLYTDCIQFMSCTCIKNAILQNEHLIRQKRFIVICAPVLKSMKPDLLKPYLDLWTHHFSERELIYLFNNNKFDLKVLVAYLANVILKILDAQKSNEFFDLYTDCIQFMDCTFIQNAILKNEYLIGQKRFIVICGPVLKSMKPDSLKRYLDLWTYYFSERELIDLFNNNKFDLKVLVAYLAKTIEDQRCNNKRINTLYQKVQEEIVRLTKLREEQQKKVDALSSKLKEYKNEMHKFRQENGMLNEECKGLQLQLRAVNNKYDTLYSNTKNYRNWGYENITDWIIGLNEEYKIYKKALRNKLKEEQVKGSDLSYLNTNDLDRFGIKAFKHKKSIMNEIHKLVAIGSHKKQNNNEKNEGQFENEGQVTALQQ